MKRVISLLFVLFATLGSFAQMQQGIVKTPTRRNVDGTMTKGQYIPNATVGIQFANSNTKQSHVSGSQGEFSFSAASPYYVASVTAKKGTYTFIDADFAKKQRRYSTNVLEILVDDPNVLSKVREEAVAHERRKIKEQIRAKEDEIEALKEANEITTTEYNKMLGELSEYRKSSEAIVHQIAEVYATTDFDQMDDFNRQLLEFVEDGNFASADSLLKTKGSKEEQFARIKEAEAAIDKTEQELLKAKEYNAKDKESFAQQLYSEHLMYMQRPMMQDSALYCMKLRADLDTTNVDAAFEYANLCYKQKKYKDCEKYYLICLRANTIINDIPVIATILNNLGLLYSDQQCYSNSEKYYKMALENYELLSKENPDTCRSGLAGLHNNLGSLYYYQHHYPLSEMYYKMALENYEHLFKEDPDTYRGDLAITQNNLGALYNDIQDYAISEKYYKLALENRELLFKENPDAYRYDLAMTQNNLGTLYYDLQDYTNSEKYFKLALENRELLFKDNPDAYRRDFAETSMNLMRLYDIMCFVEGYDKYLDLALDSYTALYQAQPTIYLGNLIDLQNGKVLNLLVQGSVDEALALAQKTYSMDTFGETTKDYLARCYESKAFEYADIKDFAKAMDSIDSAIALVPDNIDFYNSKGILFLMQGKNEEALEMWKKVLEFYPNFLDEYPDGTNLSNGLKKLGLIK